MRFLSMKANAAVRFAAAVSLASFMFFYGSAAALASTADAAPVEITPAMALTRAWDSLVYTLGGVPESVQKIEYAGSDFYLALDVTADDCLAILEGRPEVPLLKAAKDSGVLYGTPVYIFWNTDKTVLMIHSLYFDLDALLTANIIPADPPESLVLRDAKVFTPTRLLVDIDPADIYLRPLEGMTAMQTVEYMLSDGYTEAVRGEFYRILNEYRADNGLRELDVNLELQGYADIRAVEQRTLFGHTRPGGNRAGSGWHNSYNVMNSRYAENCIGASTLNTDPVITAASIFWNWKNSPGHNEHMLYEFDSNITMALGLVPEFDEHGVVSSGIIFATGY